MLKYNVRGKSVEIADASRDYVQERLDKPEKYFEINSDVVAHISLKIYPDHTIKAEVAILLPHSVLRTEDTTDGTCKSIDFVSKKLECQTRKYKTHINRKSREKELRDFLCENLEEEKKTPKEFDVVRNKHLGLKPMNAEEAVLQMDLLGHDFFALEDAGTNGTGIVYRRNDSRYDLTETNE